MEDNIRWKQRFYNYQKALIQLTKFIDKGELNELEEQGIINKALPIVKTKKYKS